MLICNTADANSSSKNCIQLYKQTFLFQQAAKIRHKVLQPVWKYDSQAHHYRTMHGYRGYVMYASDFACDISDGTMLMDYCWAACLH